MRVCACMRLCVRVCVCVCVTTCPSPLQIMGKTWFTRARLIPDEPLWPGIGLIHFAHEGTNKIQLAWAEHRNS